MRELLKLIAFVVVTFLVLLGLVFWEIANWRECLKDHSWWYCLRLFVR